MNTMSENYSPERLEAMELLNKVSILVQAENYDAAAAMLDEAAAIDPMYMPIYKEKGNLHVIRDEYAQAMKNYEKCLLLDKENGEVYFHIGNLHLLQEHFGEAIQAYGQAEEKNYSIALLPENLAYCYEQTNQTEAALSAYLRAVRMNPDNPLPRLRRIHLQLSLGYLESAYNATEEFIHRFPDVSEGYELMTDILVQMQDYDKAAAFLDDAMETYVDSSVLTTLRARIYVIQEQHDKALELVEKARKMDDLSDDHRTLLYEYEARILLMKDNLDGALAVYQKMIDEENGRVNVEARLTQLNLLNAAKRYEDLLKAASSAIKTGECDGTLCLAYVMEPLALENLGRLSEAKSLYESAIRKLRLLAIQDSSHVDTYLYRAMCYRGLGDYEKALKQLQFYDDLGIRNPDINEYRAQIYDAMGDVAKATEQRTAAEAMRNK